MDTLESTFVLLAPPKPCLEEPCLGGLKLEFQGWSEVLDMMVDYKCVSGGGTENQSTQTETDDRLEFLSSKEEEKTVKPGMRDFGVNVNMNVVRPFQRPVECKEKKQKESKLDCQNGSKIKRVSFKDYKERRRASFEGKKKHSEEKGSHTNDGHRMIFRAQMDFLNCHFKRLKNLITRILHERPSKCYSFASEYVTHITDITMQLASEDLTLVMARDKEEVDKMKENRFWEWTSEKEPSDRYRNGSAIRNDQLESDAETNNARLIVSCSEGGREVTTTKDGFDPRPFDERRDPVYDDEYHRDSSNESESRNCIGNLLSYPDRSRVEFNARSDYCSRLPFNLEETALSDRGAGELNGKDMSEIPTDERRQEFAQFNYQEHEPAPNTGNSLTNSDNSLAEERSRCAPSDPRRPRDRPHFAKKHFQERAFPFKPVEDRSVFSEPHQYPCGERPHDLNGQMVPFGSNSPTSEKDDRGASPHWSRVWEERDCIRREAKPQRVLFDRGGERSTRARTDVRNEQVGYRRDGHKPHHSRVDSFENRERGSDGRNSCSLGRLRTSIRHTRKPILLQRKYPRREVARRRSRSPPSKQRRQGYQRNHPAHEHRFKRATPTRVRNVEAFGKRKSPPRDPLLQRAPRYQPRDKDQRSTARPLNEAPDFGPESSLLDLFGDSSEDWRRGEKRQGDQPRDTDQRSTARPLNEAPDFWPESSLLDLFGDSSEDWRRGEKRQGGRTPPHLKAFDQSTDSDPFPFWDPS